MGAGVAMCAATATFVGERYQARSDFGRAWPCERKPTMPPAVNSDPTSVVPSKGSPKVGEKLMAVYRCPWSSPMLANANSKVNGSPEGMEPSRLTYLNSLTL